MPLIMLRSHAIIKSMTSMIEITRIRIDRSTYFMLLSVLSNVTGS